MTQALLGLLLGLAFFSFLQILYSARIGAHERQQKWHVIGSVVTMIFILVLIISMLTLPASF